MRFHARGAAARFGTYRMLTTLRIRNLALVADLTLELGPGFNAITGETGAGKSILIGALNLLLGQRADRSLLRAGTDACTVEAVFDTRELRVPLRTFLADNALEPSDDGSLFLKRTLTAGGTNRQFINGSPASLQALAALGEWLVDIHGPHDHQSLFQPARQLELLDAYAGLLESRSVFAALASERDSLDQAKTALIMDEEAYHRELDLLRHQAREIGAANLNPSDEDDLEAEHARVRNAARLLELAHGAMQLLTADEDSLVSKAGGLGRCLQELLRLDPGAGELARVHATASETLAELQSALDGYIDRVDLDPARLQALEDRLNLVQALRRKYGGSIEAVLAFGRKAAERLAELEGRNEELARINTELGRLDAELHDQGAALTAGRQRAVPRFCKAVETQLRDLGFRQSEFRVELSTTPQRQRSGCDAAEFVFAPNPGEPPRPLRSIASSGELARVMLALKTVLAAQDNIPVLIFDEVDANVSGETAHAVGEKMRQIGRKRQVLCITHLAPVAAAGDGHFVVNKMERDGRTVSSITPITGSDRVQELARMLGGGAAARQHAQALLESRTGRD